MTVIASNTSALRAANASTSASKMLSTAMERLSSGKRINSAKDDAAGLAIATLVPVWEASLLGFALVGAGCSNVVPVLYSAIGRQSVMPEHIAIPAVTTLGYAGILAGPAAIGFVAHLTSLSAAFLMIALLLVGVAASSRWLR